MQSNNPVFRRSEEFNRGGANAYGNQGYAGNGRRWPATASDRPVPVGHRHAGRHRSRARHHAAR